MTATATNIREESYIFKSNATYLSQSNWQNFFNKSLPAGFYEHYGYYDASANKYKLEMFKGILYGLQFSSEQDEALQPTTGDAFYYLKYDPLTAKFHLAQLTGIGSTAAESINFLTQMMVRYSRSLKDLCDYLYSYVGTSFVLPVAYYVSGHGYWDLLKIIPPNDESYPGVVSDTGDSAVATPYAGQLAQHGLSQIYGKHDYNITLQSGYTVGEYHLYPVPAISTDPAKIYIKNETSSTITIKLPLSYQDMYFEYQADNSWTESSGYLTYSLTAGNSICLTMQQFACESYTSGDVNYPKMVYEVSRSLENVDPGDVYTKAEANALFETISDATTALAAKADASDVYTKTAADALLADKADADDVYTKSEVDALIEEIPVISTVYTKTETNALLAEKADADDVYEKSDTYSKTETDNLLSAKADLSSPTFTGEPKAPTPTSGDNSTKIATTAFVQNTLAGKADLNSPTFAGSPKAPTAASGTNTTQLATTAFVQNAISGKADLNSPTFTGEPKAPTQAIGDNSTKIATTAYVQNELSLLVDNVADIYVDWSTGNDSTGKGTQTAPYKTIQKAIDSALATDFTTIHIVPAVYQETLTINGKNIRMIGTTDTDIKITSNSTVSAAVTVDHGANVELIGIFSIYGQHHGLAIYNNSTVTYQYGFANDRLTVRAENAAQDVVHRAISVNYGGKFSANGEVDVYIYPNTQTSHGVEARYGGFVSITKLVADIYSNDTAVYNQYGFTAVGELDGTYGTAYSNIDQVGYCKIGNVS